MIIQVLAPTGQVVYIFIWNASGQIFNNVTHLFEVFNSLNFVNYAIAMTEQPGTGSYFVNSPSQITSIAGVYTFAGYMQLGGTPAPGDSIVTPGTFTISGPNLTGLTALISSIRTLTQDLPDSKTVWQETVGGNDQPSFPVDGSNTIFRLRKAPLADAGGVPLYIWYSIVGTGSVVRSQSGITVLDPINGIVQISPAPNPGGTPPNGVYVDYNYLWFSDAKYTEFLTRAAQMVLAGVSGPLAVPVGLNEAMLQYGIYQAFTALSSQYAIEFSSSGGEAREDAQTRAQAFRALAKDAKTNADKMRTDYYQRQGQREAPAFGDITHGFDPITPIR